MYYVTGPESEFCIGMEGVYVSPGVGAPTAVMTAAYALLQCCDGLVVMDGWETWDECLWEAVIAESAGVPLISEAEFWAELGVAA